MDGDWRGVESAPRVFNDMGTENNVIDVPLLEEVVEVTPYTAVVQLTPESDSAFTRGFAMHIRAYHDANIADILSLIHI